MQKPIATRKLGNQGLEVSALGLGTMMMPVGRWLIWFRRGRFAISACRSRHLSKFAAPMLFIR